MSMSRKTEARLLSDEERGLVASSRPPAIQALTDAELSRLAALLRERRKRARDIANRQGREMRGKVPPAGVKGATRSDGSKLKAEALSAAVKRVNNERVRRAKASAEPSQAALARKALRLKKASGEIKTTPSYRTAGKGMKPIESRHVEDLARRGEIGRVTAYVAAAQAKRDARD